MDQINVPHDWPPGALLNIRNRGSIWSVNLYPEEHDNEKPQRTITFENSFLLQEFVSNWYRKSYADPRAL